MMVSTGPKIGSESGDQKRRDRKPGIHRSKRKSCNPLTDGGYDDHRRFYQPPQGIGQAIYKTMVTMRSMPSKIKNFASIAFLPCYKINGGYSRWIIPSRSQKSNNISCILKLNKTSKKYRLGCINGQLKNHHRYPSSNTFKREEMNRTEFEGP